MDASIPGMGLLYFSMTGNEDEGANPTPPPGSKRRRLRGACAECRQRKTRCDRAKQPGNICSNCIAFNCPCTDPRTESTHEPSAKPFSSKATTNSPPYGGKTAAEHVETIVVQSTAYIDARDLRMVLLDIAQYSRTIEEELKSCRAKLAACRAGLTPNTDSASPPNTTDFSSDTTAVSPETPEQDAEEDSDALVEDFHGMKLADGGRSRYFGESSGQHLFRTAEVYKIQHEGHTGSPTQIRRPEYWSSPWEKVPAARQLVYTFPPQDLMDSLVSIYFRHWNIFIPLLHRPTFERGIASGLHLSDHGFGALVLGVCALGARLSDDPRVIFPGTNTSLSAGWEWLQQIRYEEDPDSYFAMSLYGLQRNILLTLYLQSSNSPKQCWTLGGMSLKNLQDLGRHREKRYSDPPTVEDELYRRVFWAFIFGDMYMSAFLGRPRGTSEDEHDVDYPTDCDDEYWEDPDPSKRFQQPEGKPSQVAFFVSCLKLTTILGRAQKTIYSLKRNERGAGWSQSTVAELDSALNKWLDSIPDHLKWDPHRENSIFSAQSAALYASYYHVQIQIHRSFIPSPSNDKPLFSSFPSLAICSNAARACSHVMEVQAKLGVLLFLPQALSSLMDSALVLLVNVWGARQAGSSPDPQRAAADIRRCINCIAMYESRLQLAGRFCDLLATISSQVLVNPSPPATQVAHPRKRPRDPDFECQIPASQPPLDFPQDQQLSVEELISQYPFEDFLQAEPGAGTAPNMELTDVYPYSMPISTEELGHLPLYSSFDQAWTADPSLPAMGDIGLMFSFADAESAQEMAAAARYSAASIPPSNFLPQQPFLARPHDQLAGMPHIDPDPHNPSSWMN